MSTQSRLNSFSHGQEPQPVRPPEPPDDDELDELIAPNWMYPGFDVEQVNKIHELRQAIRDAEYATNPAQEYSYLIGDLITMGNYKLGDSVAIFNAGGAAVDCPNLDTKHCQVSDSQCYAVETEQFRITSRDARRREQIVFDHIDPVTFARAFRRWYDRKRNPVTALRINESGDFSHRGQIIKLAEISRRLDDIVNVYTYSASEYLPWDEETGDELTVNRSNDLLEFGARRFEVVQSPDEIPAGGTRCPHDLSEDIKCGDPCQLCIKQDAEDVYVVDFYSDHRD